MRIYNNVNAVNTQNTLRMTNGSMAKSLERLSSGLRINRASDDAAGLSVSEGLRSQIRGSDMARRNANDAIAMLQIAEAGTQEITNAMQRMRELAIQSANGTYTNSERTYIQNEYGELSSEIARIANAITYNNIPLLTGTTLYSFQVSANSSGSASVITFQAIDITGLTFGAVSSQSIAQAAISSIDTSMASVLSLRATIGSIMNRLEKTMSTLSVMITNFTDAESRIRDTDFATETTEFTRNQILTQSATSMLSQANQLPNNVLSLLK